MSESDEQSITTIDLVERPTDTAHTLICAHVQPGDRVIDATIGNGYDTVFLADLVGPTGQVDGFDIQSEAIESTQQKLRDRPTKHIVLHQVGHEKMSDLIVSPVQAVMFNLGYLPSGDKHLTTQPATTTRAIQAACDLLSPSGIITIVIYTGHPGGQEEADAVCSCCRSLNEKQFKATIHKSQSGSQVAPFLISIARL